MRHRRSIWLAVGCSVFLIGSAVSAIGSHVEAMDDRQNSYQAFVRSSTQIASSLTLAIDREEDLALGAGAGFVDNPEESQDQFLRWVKADEAFRRAPELLSIAVVSLVPASELAEFIKREQGDPSGSLAPTGTFKVTPAGSRSFYCFSAVVEVRDPTLVEPAGIDYCDSPLGPVLLAARDSGNVAYVPYGPDDRGLAVGNAIYRNGSLPATVQARRAELIGWTGTAIEPSVILSQALDNHPGIGMTFRYESGRQVVTYQAGMVAKGDQELTTRLGGGWYLDTFRAPLSNGFMAGPMAVYLLLSGVVLSFLCGLLVYLLGSSRTLAIAIANQRRDQLRHQAFHDTLTGLPNRSLVLDRMGQALVRARRDRYSIAVLVLDIDNFEELNDVLGHDRGDAVLRDVASRLSDVVRETGTVGRLEGDKFVIVSDVDCLASESQVIVEEIFGVLAEPFRFDSDDTVLRVTASIGVAEGHLDSPTDLLNEADVALHRAKAAGKERAMFFLPSMQHALDDLRSLKSDFQRALHDEQLFLLYQPTFDLRTWTVNGVEALIRWRHPVRGVLSPDRFIPALESGGMIAPVGSWTLRQSCGQAAAWHAQGHDLAVSVNISARHLDRDRFVDDVNQALGESGIDPHLLVLELTETALLQDAEETVRRLNILKDLGIRLAIDDFGTGYASVAYLQQFPFDIMKIDKSFVSTVAESNKAAAIVHTFVELGRTLGLQIVAEGIEDNAQRIQLLREQITTGQGYLFSRPLDPDAVDLLLTPLPPISAADANGRPSGARSSVL